MNSFISDVDGCEGSTLVSMAIVLRVLLSKGNEIQLTLEIEDTAQ